MRTRSLALAVLALILAVSACKKSSSPTAPPATNPPAADTATFTPSVPPTSSPTGSTTPIPSATNTASPTATFTSTPTWSSTSTGTSIPIYTFTQTLSPTDTLSPTVSFTPTSTSTFTTTRTSTMTSTLTATPTVTDTPTATRTSTSTITFSPTVTFTETPYCSFPVPVGNTAALEGDSPIEGYFRMIRIVPPANGRIIALRVETGVAGPGTCRAAVYSNGISAPLSLLSQSNPAILSGAGYHVIDLPDVTVTTGLPFWIGVLGGPDMFLSVNTASFDTYEAGQAYGACPDEAPAGYTTATRACVAALFCDPLAPTFTPSPTITLTPTNTLSPTITLSPTVTLTPNCSSSSYVGNTSAYIAGSAITDYLYLIRVTAPGNGSIDAIRFYKGGTAVDTNSCRAVVYSHGATAPLSLLSQSGVESLTGDGYHQVDIPDVAAASGTSYWIGVLGGPGMAVATNNDLFDTYWASSAFGDAPPAAPAGSTAGNKICAMAVFCDPTAPTYTPTPTVTHTFTPTATSTVCGLIQAMGYLQGGNDNNLMYNTLLVRAQPAGAGMLSSVSFRSTSGATTALARVAVYDGNASAPTTLLRESAAFPVPAAGAYDGDVPDMPVTAGAFYWLAVRGMFFNIENDTTRTGPSATASGGSSSDPFPTTPNVLATNIVFPSLYSGICYPALTPTRTFTITNTPQFSFTPTRTRTPTPTLSPTVTLTLTQTPCTSPTPVGWPTEIFNSQAIGYTTHLFRFGGPGSPAGRITSMRVILGGADTWRGYVYADNGSGTAPDALMTYSASLPVGTYDWHVADLPDVQVAADDYYWVGFWGTTNAYHAYQAGTPDSTYWFSAGNSTPQDPCPSGVNANYRANVVVDFCP